MQVTSSERAVRNGARRALAWVSSELGGLDLLINNAGVMRGDALSAPEAASGGAEEIEVNLGGSVRMTRLALPLLEAAPRAGVVFISSAVALTAVPGLAVYAATKAAVHSLARSVRAELRERGIRVFEVLPPVVDADPVRNLDVAKIPPARVVDAILRGVARDREQIPVGQVGQLAFLARVAPRLADRVLTRALRARHYLQIDQPEESRGSSSQLRRPLRATGRPACGRD